MANEPSFWGTPTGERLSANGLLGNVTEICYDDFDDLPAGAFTDYLKREDAHHGFHVIRGDSYYTVTVGFADSRGTLESYSASCGFRVLCELAPTTAKPPQAIAAPVPKIAVKPKPKPGTLPMSTAEANLLQRLGAESLVVTVFAQDSFNATSSAAKENVKIKMVFIPPGGPFNATDIDTATLTKPYYLGETEVTVDQFDRFIRYCKPAYITNG